MSLVHENNKGDAVSEKVISLDLVRLLRLLEKSGRTLTESEKKSLAKWLKERD